MITPEQQADLNKIAKLIARAIYDEHMETKSRHNENKSIEDHRGNFSDSIGSDNGGANDHACKGIDVPMKDTIIISDEAGNLIEINRK